MLAVRERINRNKKEDTLWGTSQFILYTNFFKHRNVRWNGHVAYMRIQAIHVEFTPPNYEQRAYFGNII
jgi:hypothetical protein